VKLGEPVEPTPCAAEPVNVHVTVPPAEMESIAGFCVLLCALLKKKSPTVTPAVPGATG
jgi:hypothetical protein